MKVLLTNLSNDAYKESRFLLNESAKKFKINEIKSYDFNDLLNTSFYLENEPILKHSKGLGFWIWKPYIILEAMSTLDEGDVVVYSDCGIELISDIKPLVSLCEQTSSIVLFGNSNYNNAMWTKRDCFVLMGCDHEKYWYGPHCDASFSLFKKTDLSLKFLNEWLKYGSNINIISSLPNICGKDDLAVFREHRWDQSILSLLAQIYELDLFRMPSQFGNHYKKNDLRIPNEFNCIDQSDQRAINYYSVIPYYNSHYGQLLNHHRSKTIKKQEEIISASITRKFTRKFEEIFYSRIRLKNR